MLQDLQGHTRPDNSFAVSR